MLNREDATVGLATVVIGAGAVAGATATNETGPILAFVGALLVSALAAYTANRRQERQLSHERRRLERQLAHDRQLSDVADLRRVVEEALDVFDENREVLRELFRLRGELGSQSVPLPTQFVAQVEQMWKSGLIARNHLGIRIAVSDPLWLAYRKLLAAVEQMRRVGHQPSLDAQEFERADDELVEAHNAFLSEAQGRIGSMIYSRPEPVGDA